AEAHRGQQVVDLPGNWRAFGVPSRGLPGGEVIDQPMIMSRTDQGPRRVAGRPGEPDNRGDVIRPQPGAGFFDRFFR
ncbi:hypothetical protein, partial [Stenotrophomonas maltophilia]|uniref:hypothetical protein n=1 Tax=Stenotrophomonas maltophilia TaxID=40324 RepID=UPI0013D98793